MNALSTAAASAQTAADPSPTAGPVPAPRELRLRFTGSAAQYFRIWVVNTCLTLLTLGIYSAWAKVRKKRYFYSHTVLDGTPFQYLGQPIPILKGRIVATVLLGVWYVGTHFVIELIPIVFGLGLVLAPWVLVRSAAFNARYSAFRNMTFEFAGGYWSALKVMYGWAIVTLLTFGLGFAWWQQRLKQYMMTRYGYGGLSGEFAATGRQFFRTYAIAGLMFGGALAIVGGIAGALFFRGESPDQFGFFIVLTVATYALYAAAFAYIQARIGNLVWNHTRLGPLTFQSRLRARELLALYLTNLLAIVASAGLLIPWAMVRMHKYRAARFSVTAERDLHAFTGSPASSVQAAGAEVGEFFDFDMSL